MASSIIPKALNGDISSLNDAFANYAPLTSDKATAITANTDLDTLETAGMYQAGTNAVAQTLSNCPTRNAFVLYVTMRSSGRPIQIIIDNLAGLYIRVKQSVSAWSSWAEK